MFTGYPQRNFLFHYPLEKKQVIPNGNSFCNSIGLLIIFFCLVRFYRLTTIKRSVTAPNIRGDDRSSGVSSVFEDNAHTHTHTHTRSDERERDQRRRYAYIGMINKEKRRKENEEQRDDVISYKMISHISSRE